MQKLQAGLCEKFALRPGCNYRIKGIRSANDAFQVGANPALLVSANFARDSY